MRLTVLCAMLLLFAVSANAATQSDVVFGAGSNGPYALSWKNILSPTVNVTESGLPLVQGLDYTIDAGNGRISFAESLGQKQTAFVSYQYDPLLAQRNSGSSISPIRIDFTQSDKHTLFLSAGFQPIASQPTMTGNLTVALGSTWQGSGHNQFGAHMYYTPMAAGVGSMPITSPSSTGVSLAGSLDAGRGSLLSMSYGRAGSSLQASDPSLQTGKEQVTASLHIAPEPIVATDVSYRQTDVPDQAGSAFAESSAAITVTPNKTVQIQTKLDQLAQGGQPNANTVSVSASARPFRSKQPIGSLSLTGSQSATTQLGQDSRSSKVGMSMDATRKVSINCGYADTRQAWNSSDAGQFNVGMGWKLSGSQQLQGAYQVSYGGGSTDTAQYTLGFRRNVNDGVNLSLTGTLKQYGQPSSPSNDFTTTANLGIRF